MTDDKREDERVELIEKWKSGLLSDEKLWEILAPDAHQQAMQAAQGEIERLKRGDFTTEEIEHVTRGTITAIRQDVALRAVQELQQRAQGLEARVVELDQEVANRETRLRFEENKYRQAWETFNTQRRDLTERADRLQAEVERLTVDKVRIADRCPSCQNQTLFIGSGGWLTCSWIECKQPGVSESVATLRSRVSRLEGAASRLRHAYDELDGSLWTELDAALAAEGGV